LPRKKRNAGGIADGTYLHEDSPSEAPCLKLGMLRDDFDYARPELTKTHRICGDICCGFIGRLFH
jgi:hypothetical protein